MFFFVLLTEVPFPFQFFMRENQNDEGIKLLNITLGRPEMISLLSELLVPASCPPQFFLRMYEFVIDSHIKRHDTQVLFVMLSKFDIIAWMNRYRPKLVDVRRLVELILRGLEGWTQKNAVLIQDVSKSRSSLVQVGLIEFNQLLQRHLMHLFEFDFPEYYGDILQMVLAACSLKKIMAQVLLELLNSMRRRVECQPLTFGLGLVSIKEDFRSFATKQKILSYKDLIDTTVLLTQHFQQERLNHGLHGLYPVHSDYCEVLSLLLGSVGHATVVAAVHAYPGVLADECKILNNLSNSYSQNPIFLHSDQLAVASAVRHVLALANSVLPAEYERSTAGGQLDPAGRQR